MIYFKKSAVFPNSMEMLLFFILFVMAKLESMFRKIFCSCEILLPSLRAIATEAATAPVPEYHPIAIAIAIGPETMNRLFLVT